MGAVGLLRRRSRVEVVIWAFLMIPSLGLMLVLIFPIPIVLLVMVMIGALLDTLANVFRIAVLPMPKSIEGVMAQRISELQPYSDANKFSVDRLCYIPNDLSIGAHVRGVARPIIVVSAGLLVALRRRDRSAEAILLHEIAHVAHFDRLLVSLFAIWVINIFLSIFSGYEVFGDAWPIFVVLNVIITLVICLGFAKRREFSADASAAIVVGFDNYCSLLRSATGSHSSTSTGLFHPSLKGRLEALQAQPPDALKVSRGVLALLTFCAVGGLLQGTSSGLGLMITSIAGIVNELLRKGLAPRVGRFATVSVPSSTVPAKKAAPFGPMGNCPNCSEIIPLSSEDCPKCTASFGIGSTWKVTPR